MSNKCFLMRKMYDSVKVFIEFKYLVFLNILFLRINDIIFKSLYLNETPKIN